MSAPIGGGVCDSMRYKREVVIKYKIIDYFRGRVGCQHVRVKVARYDFSGLFLEKVLKFSKEIRVFEKWGLGWTIDSCNENWLL